MKRLHEESPVAGEKRIDRVQTCHAPRRARARVEPLRAGEPAESEETDIERDQGNPERRHRDAGERRNAQRMVGWPVATKRGKHAKRDSDDCREEDRVECQLTRGRDELAEVVGYGAVRERRLAEV